MTETKDLALLESLKSDITLLIAPTTSLQVRDFQSAQAAVEAAKQVKEFSKRIEATRKELVDPLNARVKQINDYAKSISSPLLQAEGYLKSELVAFELDQERVRQEALKKAEEEARQKAAELRAKQEDERRELESKMATDSDAAAIFGSDPASVAAAQDEASVLAERQAQEQALSRVESKQKEWDIAQMGVKNSRKVWKCAVTDIDLVPKEYLLRSLNEKAVLAIARGGTTKIPGVRLWQETSIAIGSNTYIPKVALTGTTE